MKRRMLRLQWCAVFGFLFVGSLIHAMEMDPDEAAERKEKLVRGVYRADNWWSNTRGSIATFRGALAALGKPEHTRELTEQLTQFCDAVDKAWPAIQAQLLAQAGMTSSAQQAKAPDLDEVARQFAKGLRLDESNTAVVAWAAAKGIQDAGQGDSLD